jgi:hypothetical protein
MADASHLKRFQFQGIVEPLNLVVLRNSEWKTAAHFPEIA